MNKNFEKIKRYYDEGLWSKERLRNVVSVGKLTKKEYETITGEKY